MVATREKQTGKVIAVEDIATSGAVTVDGIADAAYIIFSQTTADIEATLPVIEPESGDPIKEVKLINEGSSPLSINGQSLENGRVLTAVFSNGSWYL